MGMDTYDGPKKRRIGVSGDDRVNQSIRLTRQAGDMVDALREPGVLAPAGCPMGDVIARAILEFRESDIQPVDLLPL